MASDAVARRSDPTIGALAAVLVILVAITGVVLGQDLVAGPALAPANRAIPLPDETYTATTIEAESLDGLISEEEAVAIARRNPSNLVGTDPHVQLLAVDTTRPASAINGFQGYVILSTDVPGAAYGPANAPRIEIVATYSWVFVSVSGDVVAATQASYLSEDSVPAIP